MIFREFKSLKKGVLRVVFLLSVVILLSMIAGCTPEKNGSTYAVSGVADLSRNGHISKIIDLNGEWEFYPGVLLSPSDFDNPDNFLKPVFLHVPGDWNKLQGAKGIGTYRLKVMLPAERKNYSVKIKWVRTICKVWADNTLLAQIGEIREPVQNSIPEGNIAITDVNTEGPP